MQPTKITLNPLDRATADEIIMNYADKKDYKINFKVKKQFNQVTYFFTVNKLKVYSGSYDYNKKQLTYLTY
jgi:hypothetical protein